VRPSDTLGYLTREGEAVDGTIATIDNGSTEDSVGIADSVGQRDDSNACWTENASRIRATVISPAVEQRPTWERFILVDAHERLVHGSAQIPLQYSNVTRWAPSLWQ
jgi:hypothetical protein